VAARFGGEEFAAFLLDAQYAQAVVAAERVRSGVEEHPFRATRRGSPEVDERTLSITISIGVAAYPEDAQDPIQLVELADTALYRAKRSGRNRVCAYSHMPLESDEVPLLPSRTD
jgi:diguanylate cyclase